MYQEVFSSLYQPALVVLLGLFIVAVIPALLHSIVLRLLGDTECGMAASMESYGYDEAQKHFAGSASLADLLRRMYKYDTYIAVEGCKIYDNSDFSKGMRSYINKDLANELTRQFPLLNLDCVYHTYVRDLFWMDDHSIMYHLNRMGVFS